MARITLLSPRNHVAATLERRKTDEYSLNNTHGGWKFIQEIGGKGLVSRGNNGPRGEKSAIAAKKKRGRGGGEKKKERRERGKRAAERMADNAEMQDGETGA